MNWKKTKWLGAFCLWPLLLAAQDPCCEFQNDVAQGWQVSFPDPNRPCLVQVCAPQFFDDPCPDEIPLSDLIWGDGSPTTPGTFPLQMCYTHEYAASGTYTINSRIFRRGPTGAVCDSALMSVTVTVDCAPPSACCINQNDFLDKIAQGWQINLIDECEVVLCAPQFEGDCYFLTTSDLNWGDGNVVIPALLPLEDCYSHTYEESGAYLVRGVICEVDAGGQTCWCEAMEVTLSVDCPPPPDSCCADYPTFLEKAHQGWQVDVQGLSVTLSAPQLDSTCHVLAGAGPDWGDGSSNDAPGFSPLLPEYTHTYSAGGLYEIRTIVCEQDEQGCVCWCEEVPLVVDLFPVTPSCCNDTLAFFDRVDDGFEILQSGCCITAVPNSLDTCDRVVEWCVDGLCLPGPFDPNDGFTWCFSEGGPHEICMKVQMLDADGTLCAEATHCQTLDLDCQHGDCACGPWELSYSTVVSPMLIQTSPVDCGDTIGLACDQSVWFSGNLTCAAAPGAGCTPQPLWWQLTDPNAPLILIHGQFFGSEVNIFLDDQLLDEPGLYELGIFGNCGNDDCSCTLFIEVPPCSDACCNDTLAFQQRVAQGYLFEQSQCCYTFKPAALNPCDRLVEWCIDGTPVPASAASGAITWCFDESGPHEICMKAQLLDPATGAVCAEESYCDTLQVNCNPGCPCGPWEISALLQGDDPQNALNLDVQCADTLLLDCSWKSITFNGSLSCLPGTTQSCTPEFGFFEWRDPLGNVFFGLMDGQQFSISFSALFFPVPGVYTLSLSAQCGGQPCFCTIYIVRPNCEPGCCSDQEAFLDRVEQGFAWNASECCIAVTPEALDSCDVITQWCWGDGDCTTGFFPPDATLTHCFPAPGTYEVCMTAAEIEPASGALCWEATHCQTITVECPGLCSCDWDLSLTLAGVLLTPSCGDTLLLDCPLTDLSLSGILDCNTTFPNCAPPGDISWTLHRPEPLDELSGTAGSPAFTLPIPAEDIEQPGLYALEITGSCGTDTCSCTLYFTHDCPPLATEEPEWLDRIRLLPNPATVKVHLLLPAEGRAFWKDWSAHLYTLQGHQLARQPLNSGSSFRTFDVAALPAATYRLALQDEQGRVRWAASFVKVE